ncbi:ATP cone domain-containing protein [Pilibacter termitis]|uniref:ATP cone domain-containing protein n=1 Tax=Pilibacter termitis TaxID=263852 RepID=A0A1T4LE31_9ENTE|nr:ATP cone domain-containing protein [Pilibacter termitis]SJZ52923.1 ATP cone domain-containing protein [Pilibacter termitis]
MEMKLYEKFVIKRDGRLAYWDSFRIQAAIFKAAAYGKYAKNPVAANDLANNVTKVVEKYIANLEFEKVPIDEIQNVVVKQLRDFDTEVAGDFLKYKTERDIKRI